MSKKIQTRREKDSLGEVEVSKDSYFGAFTTRAQKNFQISGLTAPESFKKALGIIKLSAASSNFNLKLLKKSQAEAIYKAATEFIDGKFDHEFTLDIFQAGAGTSYNMNCNEIIANRANELLKGKKGEYKFVHPNNHVNLGQSTNDVIPTATRLAILLDLPELIKNIQELEKELEKKAKENSKVIKVGRTHLQDAVPITFSQVFDSYKESLKKSREFIIEQAEKLKILGIGGTAVGSGINTDPGYEKLMIRNLSKVTKINFSSAENLTEIANNMTAFSNFSATLRALATNLLNIASDIKLMNMGPKAGLAEISIPEVQEGSSIMPGKVNPSIPECLEMVCLDVLGNDQTIALCSQKSNFELNVMCPLIMQKLLFSIKILSNGVKTFNDLCIKGLKINKEHVAKELDQSLAFATSLAPYLGYRLTAEIVKSALKNQNTLKEEIIQRKIYTEKELNEILSIENLTKPSKIIKKLIRNG